MDWRKNNRRRRRCSARRREAFLRNWVMIGRPSTGLRRKGLSGRQRSKMFKGKVYDLWPGRRTKSDRGVAWGRVRPAVETRARIYRDRAQGRRRRAGRVRGRGLSNRQTFSAFMETEPSEPADLSPR